MCLLVPEPSLRRHSKPLIHLSRHALSPSPIGGLDLQSASNEFSRKSLQVHNRRYKVPRQNVKATFKNEE